MKKTLAMAVLFGVLHIASAATTNIYVQDWGTTNGGASVTGDGHINLVGWTGVAGSQTAAPYLGIYAATGASDSSSGAVLPTHTVYFTVLTTNQTLPGMFYTTDTAGAGAGGDSSFIDIDPTQYTNLSLSVEVRGAATDTNYFAIRVGPTQWYVSITQLPGDGGLAYPTFTNDVVPYTNAASAWKLLTINTTNVTIGATPGANLSGLITGIGIVELPTAGGFNYNQLAVTAFAPNPPPPTPPTITVPPTSQIVYAGGGASFLLTAAGTPPLTYFWLSNGVTLVNGGRISGATSNIITITNINASDATGPYSVIVSNAAGTATNSGFTLTVNPVPADFLYAETFPYIGPNGNLPITGVGWLGAFQGNTGIYTSGGGVGNVFSYSGVATTNIYYTTITNDTGASGLPFVAINPDSEPNVTFQANFTPGNGAGLNSSNVVAYWAVQMLDGTWYSSAKRIPVQTISQNNYQPYQMLFTRAATNWNTLLIGSNSAAIGGHPGADLASNITGAGIVITHLGLNGGGDFNFNSFVLTTNPVTVLPPSIAPTATPFSQAVASGGGVSFGVSATGSQPFTYGWTLKGVTLVNGGRISGANSPTVTIANVTSNDAGQVIAYVTNSVGSDNSGPSGGGATDTELTVTNAPVNVLYSETFPFVGPLAGNYPISSAGWVEAAPGVPNSLYEIGLTSDGAVFAYLGSAGATAYYTTSTADTNQAGLLFPNINLAFYTNLSISVDIAPNFAASNVTAYLAVQIGANWYVAATALPVPTTDSPTFATYSTAFNSAAVNWKNLTISGAGALIGSSAAGDLKGMMTGAGLVFVTVGTGGTHNFDNFLITGTPGGINVGPLTGGNLNLSWIANPVVGLQSTTSLSSPSWTDVGGTLGQSSASVSVTGGGQMYFRLASH